MQTLELATAAGQDGGLPDSGLSIQVLDKLGDYVATENFIGNIVKARQWFQTRTEEDKRRVEDIMCGPESSADQWQEVSHEDDFVLVEKDDAVEGMAYYIALYLATVPEAQKLQPIQLQDALKVAFKSLKKSKYRQLWEWGKFLYRWSAIGYSAAQVWCNPWLMRAIAFAVWQSSRTMLGMVW